MAEDSDLERTEPASEQKIQKAREEGQVPQSRDLSTFMVLLVGVGTLWVTGSWISQHLRRAMTHGFTFSRESVFDVQAMATQMSTLFGEALAALAPFFIAVMLAAVLGPLAMGSVIFSGKALGPDFSRLSPMKGLSRIFSMHGLGELVKSLLKVAIIGAVVWWVIRHEQDHIFSLFRTGLRPGLASFLDILMFSTMMTIMGLALVAALDVPFQLWQYHDRLKMTKEDVRQENKESEGDPHVKGRIRSMQRQMARRRMMAEVPKANVVVTNPTHFSVALRYDGDTMAAPQVVAKGSGHLAGRIRELARENNVPIVEAPPLARALFKHTEPGDTVPSTLFTAVAEVMAYIYHLNHFLKEGGLPPPVPTNIAVPDGMDPGAVA